MTRRCEAIQWGDLWRRSKPGAIGPHVPVQLLKHIKAKLHVLHPTDAVCIDTSADGDIGRGSWRVYRRVGKGALEVCGRDLLVTMPPVVGLKDFSCGG